jgi:hypothetical protein
MLFWAHFVVIFSDPAFYPSAIGAPHRVHFCEKQGTSGDVFFSFPQFGQMQILPGPPPGQGPRSGSLPVFSGMNRRELRHLPYIKDSGSPDESCGIS